MHPNNLHNASYPLDKLTEAHSALKKFVHTNSYGKTTIDFSDAEAVLHLNKALLAYYYNISEWNIPKGYLCPPIPSRADYLHHIKELLSEKTDTTAIHLLDIGTGANCIYPLLAHAMFQWTAVGCDIDNDAVVAAQKNVAANKEFSGAIAIRHQPNNANLFEGVIRPGEYYHVSVCNPPFYRSAEEANKSTLRKLKKLNPDKSVLNLERNFQGQPNELWCNGGEALFIKRLIKQSVQCKEQVGWFSTLVSSAENLPKIYKQLDKLHCRHRTLQMTHGSKKTRVVAWQF